MAKRIRVSVNDVTEIRQRYAERRPLLMHGGNPSIERISMDDLARIYRVSVATIANILNHKSPYDYTTTNEVPYNTGL